MIKQAAETPLRNVRRTCLRQFKGENFETIDDKDPSRGHDAEQTYV